MTARFITFEGGEGAGKSTQIEFLANGLRSLGINVVVTREPGGTTGGEAVRELIVHGAVDRWNAVSESLLLNAARADHVQRVIRPALEAGSWVMCDRFVDSTLVYQGFGKGILIDDLCALHRYATGDLWPDLTIILDVALDVAIERIAARSEQVANVGLRFEAHALAFHRAVADGFRRVAEAYPDRCRLIDANGSLAEVNAAIVAAIEPLALDA